MTPLGSQSELTASALVGFLLCPTFILFGPRLRPYPGASQSLMYIRITWNTIIKLDLCASPLKLLVQHGLRPNDLHFYKAAGAAAAAAAGPGATLGEPPPHFAEGTHLQGSAPQA